MKKQLPFLFCFLFSLAQAQVTVSGKVMTIQGTPIQGASVYINNTTIGTNSDEEGYFYLALEHGYHTLTVSHVGFETTSYNVNTLELPDEVIFQLFERVDKLDEIVIKNKRTFASKKPFFFEQFVKHFIGRSHLSQKTVIQNREVLEFNYDENTNTLEVSASEPLIIENRGLGYKITYDLISFQLKDFGSSYLGFIRYENLEGNERQQKRWEKERRAAYFGSLRHFLNVTIHKKPNSGFVVDRIKLVPNPNVPSEEEMNAARKVVERYGSWHLTKRTSFDMQVRQTLESANTALKRSQVNPFIEIPLQTNVSIEDYFMQEDEGLFLFLEDEDEDDIALRVRYLNAYQEDNFRKVSANYTTNKEQKSRMTLLDEQVLINPKGLFHNPLDVYLEGYWAFKKVADELPLDYKPEPSTNK